jgi:hypothetical protein
MPLSRSEELVNSSEQVRGVSSNSSEQVGGVISNSSEQVEGVSSNSFEHKKTGFRKMVIMFDSGVCLLERYLSNIYNFQMLSGM